MSSDPEQQLITTLRNTLEEYRSLRDVVEEKQDVLLERDVEKLESITEKEQFLADELTQLNRDREQLWDEIIPADEERDEVPLDRLLEHVSDDAEEELREVKVDLKEVVRDVRRLNEENALLLENRISVFDRLFELITEDEPDSETYGPNTETEQQSTTPARLVDEAI